MKNSELSNLKKTNLQLQLFQALDGDKYELSLDHKYSNSVTSIDLVPRFYRGVGSKIPTSSSNKSLKFENKFSLDGQTCICTVTPAIINVKDYKTGDIIEYAAFPSDAEELIEKIIFLIASVNGLHPIILGGNKRFAVSFSLYQIKQYLKMMGSDKSYAQIKQSLLIIRDSSTRITKNGIEITKDVWSDSAIEMTGTGRGKEKCYIAFSDYVIDEILDLKYRQVLFSRFTAYSSTFSRYLDLYLSSVWSNANFKEKKSFSLLEIMESYGKANKSMVTKRRDMRVALADLVNRKVIIAVPNAVKIKISSENSSEKFDYIYQLEPTKEFVEETKIANGKKRGLETLHKSFENGERQTLPNGMIDTLNCIEH